MKRVRVRVRVLCIFILSLFVAISCQQPTNSEKNTSTNSDNKSKEDVYPHSELTDEAYVDSVLELLDLGSVVIPNGNIAEIIFPRYVSDYKKASISWTSSNSSVFPISGYTGYVSEPSVSQVSIITASVSKGTVSKTKTFPIKVYSKNQTSISDEDYVQAAKSLLGMGEFVDTVGLLGSRRYLASIKGAPKDSNYKDLNGTIFSYDQTRLISGNEIDPEYGTVRSYGEIVERVYSFKVTMTKNSAKTTKTLYYIPPVFSKFTDVMGKTGNYTYNGIKCTKIRSIEISNNQLKKHSIVTKNSDNSICNENGNLYDLSIDQDQRKCTVSLCKVYYENEWLTLGDIKNKYASLYSKAEKYFTENANLTMEYQVKTQQSGDLDSYVYWLSALYTNSDGEKKDFFDF